MFGGVRRRRADDCAAVFLALVDNRTELQQVFCDAKVVQVDTGFMQMCIYRYQRLK